MSLYQVQQCLFDHLRALEKAPGGERPPMSTAGYELTDDERRAVESGDVDAFSVMGVHPVIINGYCRAQGYKRADYRPLFRTAAAMADAAAAAANAGAKMNAGGNDHAPRRGRWQKS